MGCVTSRGQVSREEGGMEQEQQQPNTAPGEALGCPRTSTKGRLEDGRGRGVQMVQGKERARRTYRASFVDTPHIAALHSLHHHASARSLLILRRSPTVAIVPACCAVTGRHERRCVVIVVVRWRWECGALPFAHR